MKNIKSYLAISLVAIIYFTSAYIYKPYNSFYRQDGGDAFGYYEYLPAIFIHHDLADLHTTMAAKYRHSAPGKKAENYYFDKYFMGTAVLQAPFFLAAHFLAGSFHEPRDGFSIIYMYAVILSCLFYTILALYILSFLLRKYFADGVVAMVVIILGLATNLYFLVVGQTPFCHAYLFFLYALLLLVTAKFYESYRVIYLLLIGLVCGLIILARFNEIYVALIPIFWGVKNLSDLRGRPALIRKFALPIAGAIALAGLCIIPQLLYWKTSTGHYLHYSYTGEKFDFKHPRIWDGLTSECNGWLVYCPIMILAVIGIWPAIRRKHPSFVPILAFIPVHIYVIYSWWCWFYMGSYGSRPMTEASALLCFPLAYTVQWFWRSLPAKLILIALTLLCSFIVISQTYQTGHNLFCSELNNWRYSVAILGKSKITYKQSLVLDTKEFQPDAPILIKQIGENNFEDPSLEGSDTTVATSGRRSICVTQGRISPVYSACLRDMDIKPGQWIKASINALARLPVDHNWHKSGLVIQFDRKDKSIKWRYVALQNRIDNPENGIWHFTTNKWGNVYFYCQVPDKAEPTDSVKVYVLHNIYGPDVYIDDLKVELYKE